MRHLIIIADSQAEIDAAPANDVERASLVLLREVTEDGDSYYDVVRCRKAVLIAGIPATDLSCTAQSLGPLLHRVLP